MDTCQHDHTKESFDQAILRGSVEFYRFMVTVPQFSSYFLYDSESSMFSMVLLIISILSVFAICFLHFLESLFRFNSNI